MRGKERARPLRTHPKGRRGGRGVMRFFGSSRNLSESMPAIGGALSRAPTLVKVALLGDAQVGKSSLMVRYVEGTFDETQLHTQGVNFMEKSIALGGQEVTFSIWDIGGGTDSKSMLPLVCNDAAAVLLMFDLSRPETLDSVREWHRKARALNRCAVPFLIGCKYDALLERSSADEHARVGELARRFAAAINAPLIFCAPSVPINVTNIFKVILVRLFGLAPAVPLARVPGQPLLIYETQGQLQLADEPEGGGASAAPHAPATAAAGGSPSLSPSRPPERGSAPGVGASLNLSAGTGSSLAFGV